MQQDGNGHAVLTAKIYYTFVCFVDLFQSILMYGGQRLKLKDTSREGAVASSDPVYAYILFAAIGLLFFVYAQYISESQRLCWIILYGGGFKYFAVMCLVSNS